MDPIKNSYLSTFAPSPRISRREIFQTLQLPRSSKILVTGAGVFGGWTALNLVRRGYDVTLADSWGPGNSMSSSGGESRLIRAIYGKSKKYFDMTLEAWDGWKELEQSSGTRLLHETGVMWFFNEADSEVREAIIEILDSRNWPYDIVPNKELRSRFPAINSEGLGNVLIEKKAGFLYARKACQKVVEQFVKEGGRYELSQVEPGSIKNKKLQDVKLNRVKGVFDYYVFACGPWLPGMFQDILKGRISVTRQEVNYFRIPGEKMGIYSKILPWIEWDPGDFYYGIPDYDNRGFKIACDNRGEICDPDTMDRVPDMVQVQRSREFLSRRFPDLATAPLIESRVCQYSNTPDGNFILDLHPEAENVWILGGGSGHGFKHGPAMGRIASGIITGEIALDQDFILPG